MHHPLKIDQVDCQKVALDTLVFFKVVKMVFLETVGRLKKSLLIVPL